MLRAMYVRCLRNHTSLFTEIRKGRITYMITQPAVSKRFSAIMASNFDIAKCFEFAKELTLQAGKIIKCNFENEKNIIAKGKWDVVTKFDHEIEKMFVDALSKEFPDHKIIAEETVNSMHEMPKLTDAPTWFLDPIDGTVNFVHSFPMVCISVGLMVCKEIVLGIIYNPLYSELYTAIKGEGAFLNGQPICTTKVTELKDAMNTYNTSYLKIVKKDKDIHLARMVTLLETTQTNRDIGSAALTLAYIARGALDCAHTVGLKPWDIAAGMVILREAGGIILDTKGNIADVMQRELIVASGETLGQQMSKLIIDTDLKTQRKRLKRT